MSLYLSGSRRRSVPVHRLGIEPKAGIPRKMGAARRMGMPPTDHRRRDDADLGLASKLLFGRKPPSNDLQCKTRTVLWDRPVSWSYCGL